MEGTTYHHSPHSSEDRVAHLIVELLRASQLGQYHSAIDVVAPCGDRIVGGRDGLYSLAPGPPTRVTGRKDY
jgi:hypothetical protein